MKEIFLACRCLTISKFRKIKCMCVWLVSEISYSPKNHKWNGGGPTGNFTSVAASRFPRRFTSVLLSLESNFFLRRRLRFRFRFPFVLLEPLLFFESLASMTWKTGALGLGGDGGLTIKLVGGEGGPGRFGGDGGLTTPPFGGEGGPGGLVGRVGLVVGLVGLVVGLVGLVVGLVGLVVGLVGLVVGLVGLVGLVVGLVGLMVGLVIMGPVGGAGGPGGLAVGLVGRLVGRVGLVVGLVGLTVGFTVGLVWLSSLSSHSLQIHLF